MIHRRDWEQENTHIYADIHYIYIYRPRGRIHIYIHIHIQYLVLFLLLLFLFLVLFLFVVVGLPLTPIGLWRGRSLPLTPIGLWPGHIHGKPNTQHLCNTYIYKLFTKYDHNDPIIIQPHQNFKNIVIIMKFPYKSQQLH